MTYPQQAPGYPPQAPPQQPPAPPQFQPAFPGGTPPQQPQQFAQPPAYGYPGQQAAYPVAPPQGYPQTYPQQPAAPQLPPMNASLDDFYSQPSSGWGPAWQLGNKDQNGNRIPDGTSYIGIVAQHITKAHLEYAVDQRSKQVRTFKNGEPVMNMKVPLYVPRDQRFTDGRAQFYVGPGEKDALAAAMAAAGAPEGPPELGSMIRATKVGSRGNSYGSESAIKQVEYWRPEQAREFAPQLGITYPDITPAPAPTPAHAAPEPQAPAAPAPAGPAVQQQAAVPPAAPQPQAPQMPPAPAVAPQPQAPSPLAASPAYPGPAPAPVAYSAPPAPGGNTGGNMTATPAAAPPAPGAMPADPEKAALLAKLTGQAAS